MLELFLVMFAVTVQSAGQEVARNAAVVPQAPAARVIAPVTNPVANPVQETASAPPAFLAPAGKAEQAAVAAPVFLAPSTAGATGGDAPPAFLAPKPTAQAEAAPVFLAPSGPQLMAEPQIPSGRYTTAIEVKPILSATKANWIAVRQYEGLDYLYVTQIWSWRCGLVQMRFGVNGGPLQVWPLPACHEEFATPNAILEGDGNPMQVYPPGSIGTVDIELTFDDLSTDRAQFSRASVLMP
ncbi:MAG: hypothetical protein QNK42_18620 [Pseudodonghicola sp.]|nr:hypothetical protein [Pseudodonghicola sp.]